MKVLFTRVGPAYDFGGEDVILALPVDLELKLLVKPGFAAFHLANNVRDFVPYELTSFGSPGALLVPANAWPQVCEILDLEDVYDMEGWHEAQVSCGAWEDLSSEEDRSDLWQTHWSDSGVRFSFHPRHEDRVRYTDRLNYTEVL